MIGAYCTLLWCRVQSVKRGGGEWTRVHTYDNHTMTYTCTFNYPIPSPLHPLHPPPRRSLSCIICTCTCMYIYALPYHPRVVRLILLFYSMLHMYALRTRQRNIDILSSTLYARRRVQMGKSLDDDWFVCIHMYMPW